MGLALCLIIFMRLSGSIKSRMLRLPAFCFVFLSFSLVQLRAQIGGPPVIAVPPLGLSVSYGVNAQLTATAVDATKGVQWLFNGIPVSTNCNVSTLNILGVGAVSTLTISNITSSSGGSYTFKASNAFASATSAPAILIVVTGTVSNVLNVVNFVASGIGKLLNG